MILGVIPARWASTRLPGKSLTPLCGKPLLQWVIERSRLARRLDRLLVATDDDRIAELARSVGADAVMTRADHPSGTDRIAEAAAGYDADALVNIQGDEPLIDPDLIDALADTIVADPHWDMATAAEPIGDAEALRTPSVVKVVCDGDDRALYFSRSPIPAVRDADFRVDEPLHWRHLGIYAYRKAFLATLVATPPSLLERSESLEQLRALHIGGRIKVLRVAAGGPGVDTPEDVAAAERALRDAGLASA